MRKRHDGYRLFHVDAKGRSVYPIARSFRVLWVGTDPGHSIDLFAAIPKEWDHIRFEVVYESQSEPALNLIQGQNFDALITDLVSTSMQSLEFIKLVRKRFRNLPIVGVSVVAVEDQWISLAYKAGMDLFFSMEWIPVQLVIPTVASLFYK